MQNVRQDGSGNIGVQIDGDHNAVTIHSGAARLTLALRHKAGRPPRKDLDLLDPYRCPIDLVGRDHDLDSLETWLGSPRPIAVQCRIGRAGSGKTRLALELCRRAETQGWTAGFLAHDELTRFQRDGQVRAWDWPEPTLVVVDYAATSAGPLRHWLEDLADRNPADHPPLRLLLLERHASGEIGWWSELTRFAGFSTAPVEDLLDPPEPLELSRINDPGERRALLGAIMAASATLHGKPAAPALPAPDTDPAFDAAITRDAIELEPLYLLMAGLTAVQTNVPRVLALTRTDLAERLAAAELDRLARLAGARGIDAGLVQHLAAFIGLMNGCAADLLPEIVTAEAAILGHTLGNGPDAIVNLLADNLADNLADEAAGQIAPIRPDLIGEAAILATFKGQRRSMDWQGATVTRAYDRAAPETTATVIRTAQDFAAGALDHPSLVWLDRLADHADDPGQLMAIANQLPPQTVNLRERAAAILSRIAAVLHGSRIEQPELLAGTLNNLGAMFSALGRREDALAATEEAVALRRELAAARPDAFKPDLAGTLNNLGAMLSALGRREDALAATEEAVALRRELAAARPDAFKPDLAGTLNNLGAMLSALGRREDALAATEEAVALRRELAAARPDAFKPDLAMSLSNLADRHDEAGQTAVAISFDVEAIRAISGPFLALPGAHADLTMVYVRDYLGRCDKLGTEPDAALLGPIVEVLQRLQAQAQSPGDQP